MTGQGWNPGPFHTRKIIRTKPVKARYHDSYGGVKKMLKCEFAFFDFFILIVLSNAWVTLLNFKSCSNPLHHARKCKNKKNSKSISVRCMGKFKTCLSFISSIPAPCYPSSSLSSFLSTVFCVFGSISLGCLAWQRLNDPNIKPSEIFKVHQKRMKCA